MPVNLPPLGSAFGTIIDRVDTLGSPEAVRDRAAREREAFESAVGSARATGAAPSSSARARPSASVPSYSAGILGMPPALREMMEQEYAALD